MSKPPKVPGTDATNPAELPGTPKLFPDNTNPLLDLSPDQVEGELLLEIPPIERHLTLDEIANAMRVHKKTVQREINSGELPAVKFGGQVRIPVSGYEDYLRRHAIRPGK